MLLDFGAESGEGLRGLGRVGSVVEVGGEAEEVQGGNAVGAGFGVVHAVFEAEDHVGLVSGGAEETLVGGVPKEGGLCF